MWPAISSDIATCSYQLLVIDHGFLPQSLYIVIKDIQLSLCSDHLTNFDKLVLKIFVWIDQRLQRP